MAERKWGKVESIARNNPPYAVFFENPIFVRTADFSPLLAENAD
jgi:hypothetical protein